MCRQSVFELVARCHGQVLVLIASLARGDAQIRISPIRRPNVSPPYDIPRDIIFSTQRMVPHGMVTGIRYVLFVSPEEYFKISTQAERTMLERSIGQLNAALKGETFIAVGPGRWGTSTPDLGVHVNYGDICTHKGI